MWCRIETKYEHNLKAKNKSFIYCYDKGCSIAVIDNNWKQFEIKSTIVIIDKEPFKPDYKLDEKDFITELYSYYNDWRVEYNNRKSYSNLKIIWHSVLIWNILNCCYIKQSPQEKTMQLLEVWKDKTAPIEQQSENCIEFVYNIIKSIENINHFR